MDDDYEELKEILNDKIIEKLQNINKEFMSEHNEILLSTTMLVIAKELEKKNEILSDIRDFILDTNDYLSEITKILNKYNTNIEQNENAEQKSQDLDLTTENSKPNNTEINDLENKNKLDINKAEENNQLLNEDDNEIFILKENNLNEETTIKQQNNIEQQEDLEVEEIFAEIIKDNNENILQNNESLNKKSQDEINHSTQTELEQFDDEKNCELFIQK